MAERIMYIQLKTGYDTDKGPAWISRVRFNKSWKTAYWRGRTLHRGVGMWDANFFDVETREEFWISGPKRDRTDKRYSNAQPEVDPDVREEYEAFLRGAALPGRERGGKVAKQRRNGAEQARNESAPEVEPSAAECRTPEAAAIAGWAGYPVDPHVVRVIADGQDEATVLLEIEPGWVEANHCRRDPDGTWYSYASSGP